MLRTICVVALAAYAVAFTPGMERLTRKTQPAINSPHFQPTSSMSSSNPLSAMLTQTELPQKLYFPQDKEMPKVLGGLQIGLRKIVVITGASSGLGLNCANTLARTGRYFVVMAVRDVEKAKKGKYFKAYSI